MSEKIYDKSEIMNELIKLAINKNALPEPNPYQENKKTIEEKRLKSPEKSIVEIAHPKPAYIAESQGDGGLVENQLEQQKKMIEVINKMPNGNLVGRYAATVNVLIKMAETCDKLGENQVADIITITAGKLLDKAKELNNPLTAAPRE